MTQEARSAANERALIAWVGDNRHGHFEVDGVKRDVPTDADLSEIKERLEGREIRLVQEWMDGYALLLSDGQILDISGIWCNDSTADTGVRFWNEVAS
jgi:hypothetical protein